jgi:transposase InsO family protein
MKCQFVDAEKARWSVTRMCKMLQFSPKAYYAWTKRGKSARELSGEQLPVQIRVAFKASRGTYGSPRLHAVLKAEGVSVGRNRVARLMCENGLSVQPRRGYRCTTTVRDPLHEVAPDTLDRDCTASAPN